MTNFNGNSIQNILKRYVQRLNTGQMPIKKRAPLFEEQVVVEKKKIGIHINLFVLTLLTTTIAGMSKGETWTDLILCGLSYSVPLMLILLSHEFGHYFAAKKFGIDATLPYFIPFPLVLPGAGFGTMGAVIKVKSPIPDRRALLYVGALGPIPGFILSIIVIIIGIYFSEVKLIPPASEGHFYYTLGDSLLLKFLVSLMHGPIPEGHDLFVPQIFMAGWLGFLITAINLMPIGQLDGGHVLYALLKKKQVYFGWIFLLLIAVLSYFFAGWILWIFIALFFLMVGHPYVPDFPDGDELTIGEKIMGWSCVMIFILAFIPVPFGSHGMKEIAAFF